jgi:hypothetical protein
VTRAVDGAVVVIGHLPAGLRPGRLGQRRVPAIERKPKTKLFQPITPCHRPPEPGARSTPREALQTADYERLLADANGRCVEPRLFALAPDHYRVTERQEPMASSVDPQRRPQRRLQGTKQQAQRNDDLYAAPATPPAVRQAASHGLRRWQALLAEALSRSVRAAAVRYPDLRIKDYGRLDSSWLGAAETVCTTLEGSQVHDGGG